MKKVVSIFAISALLTGCGASQLAPEDQVQETGTSVNASVGIQAGTFTLNGKEMPLYDNATLYQNLGVMASFKTNDSIDAVETWYDAQMKLQGYTSSSEWRNFGGSYQKEFNKGNEIVQVSLSVDKSGETLLVLLPIVPKK